VVIGIISLLAAALLPAIWGAVQRAKEARIGIEIASIGKSLEAYKLEYGEYPPDFASSAAILANGGTPAAAAAEAWNQINQHLSNIYRRRAQTGGIPLANAGDLFRVNGGALHVDFLSRLNPRNALVFWLSGFANDPGFPLASSGPRSPVFEFNKSQIIPTSEAYQPTDVIAQPFAPDGSPAVHPMILEVAGAGSNQTIYLEVQGYLPPGVSSPYVYYNASSYPNSLPLDPVNPDPVSAVATNPAVAWAGAAAASQAGDVLPVPYLSTVDTVSNGSGGRSPAFVAPEKFQIIAAGLDGFYGGPGAGDANAFLDNLCSFTDGKTLEDFLDR
jgi:type II secretory pathway pseudopilin PulG